MDVKPWKSVFLAGPIDFAKDPSDWRLYAASILAKEGVIAYNPYNAFQPAPEASPAVARYVRAINDFALVSSGCVLMRAEPSLGTGREFGLCERNRIPIVAFGPKGCQSYTLLPYDQIKFFESVDEAVGEILHGR